MKSRKGDEVKKRGRRDASKEDGKRKRFIK
jgi:hypothetical protein